jgi:myo-inositol-1(or 4)-monophosphatase
VDAFYEFNLSPWDVAAGSLIAQEAGAKVSDFNFGDHFLFGREIMAANTAFYEEFATLISKEFSSDFRDDSH